MKGKKKTGKKHTALVVCRNQSEYWTTQKQFWQWVREGVVLKTQDNPLAGRFCRENEESFVVLSNTVLNTAYPNHLQEALRSRRAALTNR